jgi:uncharacterized membrane protein YebE (DUF533 family)
LIDHLLKALTISLSNLPLTKTHPPMKMNWKTIHKALWLPLAAAMALSLTSCASGPYAKQGAVVGGLGGAAAGGIIGHQSGRGLEGAAIGGALGALGGALFGSAKDDYYGTNQQAPPPPPPPTAPGPPSNGRPPYGDRYIY